MRHPLNMADPSAYELAQIKPAPFLSMQGVSLRRYDKVLFQDTWWQIWSDQHWAVIGPNGSGKSTLIRAICGQVPIVKGQIAYHFLETLAPDTHSGTTARPRDHIAYVSFDAQREAVRAAGRFYQARWNQGVSERTASVSEYLSERHVRGLNPYQVIDEPSGSAPFTARRREVVALLGIRGLLSKRIVHLSNGEMRKVLIASALLKNPRMLILDNPFTGLDAGFRARLKQVISRLAQGEMRIMVVTSRRDEIAPDITHLLVVQDHQIVSQGPKDEVPEDTLAVQTPGPSPGIDLRLTAETHHQGERSIQKPPQVLVHMRNVNVSYDGTQVLRRIDWTIVRGQNWALLGPNGSGKTTLLSLILGDNPQAYANDITLFGVRRGSGESIWEIKRQVGWVAPELHLYYPRNVSCFDVVCSGFFDSIGLYHNCLPRQQEVARSWMHDLGISEYAHQAFAQISDGEQRMILIARALVKRPVLLALDEPCQGLDASNRQRVLRAIDAAGNHLGTTIIYVTHNPSELPLVITHVLRLEQGRIIKSGTTELNTPTDGPNIEC